jgi:autotransporter-associated beta strand protein
VTVTDSNGCLSASSSVTVNVERSPLKWVGGNGNWDFVTTGLWQDSFAIASTYCDSYDVLLDDSASAAAPRITLDTTVSPVSVTNDSTRNYTIEGAGRISGLGNLTKLGTGTLTIQTTNDYSGQTTVADGILLVNGALGTNLVTVTGGTLGGTGVISGPVIVNASSTVAPGDSIGALTVSNDLTLLAGSFTSLEVDKAAHTLDQIIGVANLTYGGTLQIANLAGTLAAGDAFKLFDAQNYSGTFASLSPATPGLNLLWDTSTLATDGTLRIVPAVNTSPTSIVITVNGNILNLSWPSDHTGWRLQVQTNGLDLGNWQPWPGSMNTNSVFVPIDPLNPSVFFRLIYP